MVEVLVVIAIIVVIAAILYPVLSQAREGSRKARCLSNMREIGVAMEMYNHDSNYLYPQCKRTDGKPDVDDADGKIDSPDYGSAFAKILPYTGHASSSQNDVAFRQQVFACPDDPAPFDTSCPDALSMGGPHVTSYLINGWFVWGLSESQVVHPSNTIDFAERRSELRSDPPGSPGRPFCGDIYHPWFFLPTNPKTPPGQDDMDENAGAISTHRHSQGSNFIFCDTHAKWKQWAQTFSPQAGIDLHEPH